MNENEIYRQADNCLLEDMDGELLLYYPPTAKTLHLNGPSAVVWQLCDGERSYSEIVDIVKQAYPDQASQIGDDVALAINELSTQQVLEKVSG